MNKKKRVRQTIFQWWSFVDSPSPGWCSVAPDSFPVVVLMFAECFSWISHHPISPPLLQVLLPAPDGGKEGGVLVRDVLVASNLGYEGLTGAPVLASTTSTVSRTDRHPETPLSPAETDRLRVSSGQVPAPHCSSLPALHRTTELTTATND